MQFGGPFGEPQGRGDTTVVLNDTLSWLRGRHTFTFGGEIRRGYNNNVALNVGTGVSTTVAQVASTLASELHLEIAPLVVNSFRHGDIRHCCADVSRARAVLGYEPRVPFQKGMRELVEWIGQSTPPTYDHTARAAAELDQRGLVA